MKGILIAAFIIFTILPKSSFGKHLCSHAGQKMAHKTTIASMAEDDYDVSHLKFKLQLTDTSIYLDGSVTTTATVVAASMPAYVFELDAALTIDTVWINGIPRPLTTTGFIRSVALSTPLAAGTVFTATVKYHGMPPSASAGFFNGITHARSAAGGTHMVYTVSDPYAARNWWPCKQSISDKIDSVDMYVKVPEQVVDASNGLLLSVDSTTDAGWWTYHWKTRYKIDYYLISIAVSKYVVYNTMHHFPGGVDSMPIQNFFFDTATFNPNYKANFDSAGQMLDFLSEMYGLYPFKNEKFGYSYSNLSGGMEHQTMVTIGVPNTYVICHELAHQWFGDNVTYKTWGDVWLSEGFATFTEPLFYEHFWGSAAALTARRNIIQTAINQTCGMVYVNDTTSSDSLFSGANVYAKGGAVVRMLQYAAPNDSVFFRMLRSFQTRYSLGLASTADLKAEAQAFYGTNLDTFFNQWIYGRGYPIYKVWYNQVGSTVVIKVVQSASCSATTPRFSNYLQFKLQSTSADSFIKVYNDQDTQYYYINWTPTVTSIFLNIDAWTLCRQLGRSTVDTTLGIEAIQLAPMKPYPNPTKNNWQIDQLKEGTKLKLYSPTGRLLWEGVAAAGNNQIPGEKLPAGHYVLQIGDGAYTLKLEHL